MATITPTPHHTWQQGPLPEILGYLGSALVVGAGFALVAQSWTTWSLPTQIAIVAAAMAALYVAAGALSLTVGGRSKLHDHVARRRLVGVLAALAAPMAAMTTGLALEWSGLKFGTFDEFLMLIVFSVALVAAVFAAWWAPGVVPTIAVALASFMWVLAFLGSVIAPLETPLLDPVMLFVGATGWLIVAPRLLPPRVLSEALGMAAFIFFQVPTAMFALDRPIGVESEIATQMDIAMWFSRAALVGFAVVALILFARGRSWAWAVGGVVAAGVGAMSIAGQTLGLIAGLLVAGVVLLAASGILIITRTRRERVESVQSPER